MVCGVIAIYQPHDGPRAHIQRGQLRRHIAADFLRLATVAADGGEDGFVAAARFNQLHGRQAKAFLEYFCRTREIAARRAAADINVMHNGR